MVTFVPDTIFTKFQFLFRASHFTFRGNYGEGSGELCHDEVGTFMKDDLVLGVLFGKIEHINSML